MADNTDTNNNVRNNGDVVNSVFPKDIHSYLDNLSRDVDKLNKSSVRIEGYFKELIDSNRHSNRYNFTSSVQDAADKIRYSNTGSSHKNNVSSSKKSKAKIDEELFGASNKDIIGDILDGIEEEFCEYVGIPYAGDDIKKQFTVVKNKILNNVGKALGIEMEDVPRAIAKSMMDESLRGLSSKMPVVSQAIDSWKKDISKFKQDSYDRLSNAWNEAINTKVSDGSVRSKLDFDKIFGFAFGKQNTYTKYSSNNPAINSDRTVTNQDGKDISYGSIDVYWDPLFKYLDGLIVDSKMFDVDNNLDNLSSRLDNASFLTKNKSSYNDNSDNKASGLDSIKDKAIEAVTSSVDTTALKSAASGVADAAADLIVGTGDIAAVGSAFGDVGAAALSLAPELAAVAAPAALVVGAFMLLDKITSGVTKAFTKFNDHMSGAGEKLDKVLDRFDSSKWNNLDEREKRMQADFETIVRAPFEILKESAEEVRDTWKQVISTVNATQGYTKNDLNSLMTAYSKRLTQEGMQNVISSTDVTQMLKSILEAGLSGKVAEEFAYQATVLNQAVPTEDWASYAESYASLVSQLISSGKSQDAALQDANQQLKTFASNILGANREVSGGLTVSLTKVSGLFSDIVKIAETAGGSDISGLSSALSIVQAVAGKVSSSTGNDLVNQIVQAATGGNSDQLVALRSMANTGASNTAFLQALYKNPNSVLATMFDNLSKMINKNQDNYMEVAHGLSDTFGVSADALVRIDWDELVSQLKSNSSSTNQLNANMDLVKSGQTTTNADSMKVAQINKYMMDNGLSYIMDNDAAWEVQQHMWQQEIAKQIMDTKFTVDLAGAGLEALQSLSSLVGDILNALTLGAFSVGSAIKTAFDYGSLKADVKKLLEAGKVGSGNKQMIHDLTTYDVEQLQQPPNILEMMGSASSYFGTSGGGGILSGTGNAGTLSGSGSKYNWGDIGKNSIADAPTDISKYKVTAYQSNGDYTVGTQDSSGSYSGNSTTNATTQTPSQLSQWVDSMADYIKQKKSFNEWYSSASDLGVMDIDKTLGSLGYSKNDLMSMYSEEATNQYTDAQNARNAEEEAFWASGRNFWENTFPTDYTAWDTKYTDTMTAWNETFNTRVDQWQELYINTMTAFQQHLDEKYEDWMKNYLEQEDLTHKKQQYMNDRFDSKFVADYLKEWKDYYIGEFTHYRQDSNFNGITSTIQTEKGQTGEAVLALAKTLTEAYNASANPQVQANVLLGQILVVLQAILTNQQSGEGLTLPTALAALGLNLTTPQTNSTTTT